MKTIKELEARITQLEERIRQLEAAPREYHYHYYPPVYSPPPVTIPTVWEPTTWTVGDFPLHSNASGIPFGECDGWPPRIQ